MTDRFDERIYQMAEADIYDAVRYERKLRAALIALPDEAPRRRHAGQVGQRIALIAVALALIACTALAAARLGFLDFARHYDPQISGDLRGLYVEGSLATCETARVRYEVRAASYDGKELQLVAAAMPKDAHTALISMDPDAGQLQEAQALAPQQLHVRFELESIDGEPAIDGFGTWGRPEERGIVFGASVEIYSPAGEALTLSIRCDDYTDAADRASAEMSFSFTPATPEVEAWAADADLGSVRVTHVELSHTALGLHVTAAYEPLTDREPNLHLVQADGSTQWGGRGGKDEDGVYRARCTYVTTQALPQTLLLWPYSTRDGCDLALEIVTQTGAQRIVPVTPELDGDGNMRVRRNETTPAPTSAIH